MQTVWLTSNPLDLNKWVEHQTEDIRALLVKEFVKWPSTARIYHQHVAQSHDVTPRDEPSEEALATMPGPFYVVVYPADPGSLLTVAAIYAVAFVVDKLILDDRKPREHIFPSGSPNNQLSARTNKDRLNERVPDGFGTFRSVPDKIQWTYQIWENYKQVEYSLYCISRGANAVTDVRDSSTLVSNIREASAVVYPPGQTPGGGTPSLVIGDMITEPVYTVAPIKQINGQQLPPINSLYLYGSGRNVNSIDPFAGDWISMSFVYLGAGVGVIHVPTNGDFSSVTGVLDIGDEVQIIWGPVPTGANPRPDLSSGYSFGVNGVNNVNPGFDGYPFGRADLEPCVVLDVQPFNSAWCDVTLSIPSSQQAEWDKIDPYVGTPGLGVENKNAVICAQSRWPVGYIDGESLTRFGLFIDDPDMTELWMNFVAPENLYMYDGVNRKVLTHSIEYIITPCDASGIPTADPLEIDVVPIEGTLTTADTRGITIRHVRGTPGRCLLYVARNSFRVRQIDLQPGTSLFFRSVVFTYEEGDDDFFQSAIKTSGYTGELNDAIVFDKAYSISSTTGYTADDITTIQTRTVVNRATNKLEERQLNCLATRQTGSWTGAVFDPFVIDTQGFGENMLFHILKDPFIGNRFDGEIDFAGIAAAFQAVRDYFGDEDATRFSYTFDNHETSVEETVLTLCGACFITPSRLGSVIQCAADIATDASALIFNHRNKVPGSEERAVTFGPIGDNDGVEQSYIDVDTGPDTFSPFSELHSGTPSVSPLKSRVVGLSHRWQAAWHAYRQLARITHQRVSTQFDAMEEAATLALKQRVLVEDNTRPDVQDGHITGVSGLVLRTSQPVLFVGGSTYTVFLQHPDNTVEAIAATAGIDDFSLTLGLAPASPINTDPFLGLQTTYLLNRNQSFQPKAFLITDKAHNTRITYAISAVNYSHMYYHADGLIYYLPVSSDVAGEEMFDRSPYERPTTAIPADTSIDALRGLVYNGTLASAGIVVPTTSPVLTSGYSKLCWIQKTSGSGHGTILSSTSTTDEIFEVDAAVILRAGHNNVSNVATSSFSINVWHHCAVTYNVLTGVMRLYLDGELVAQASSVPNRVLSQLSAFKSVNGTFGGVLVGQADALRYYARELTPEMIRETYQKELVLP